jgi:glycine cleavage system H lipoate-binding protein
MEGFSFVDIYATKGIEYLLTIAFLTGFAFFAAGLLSRSVATAPHGEGHGDEERVEWFRVPQNLFFHRGHSWMKPAGADMASVGMDDYAAKLLGSADSVSLPAVGTTLRQGEKGWAFRVAGETISMLSPVDGEVVAVNQAAVADPSLASRDPLGEGWLVKVKGSDTARSARNLLNGKIAARWIEDRIDSLRQETDPSVGLVYQDGGLPVDGLARALYGDEWAARVKEQFLTEE